MKTTVTFLNGVSIHILEYFGSPGLPQATFNVEVRRPNGGLIKAHWGFLSEEEAEKWGQGVASRQKSLDIPRPSEPGVYLWTDTVVLLQGGYVFCVLGCNNYLGLISDEKFNTGWKQKLDVEFSSGGEEQD